MNYTERHHAFLSAAYYRELRDSALPRWSEAFRMATQLYAQQRGSRMAQRALRDGQPLDFATYRAYSEWRASDASVLGVRTRTEVVVDGADKLSRIYNCAWSAQYIEMGLEDGGMAYCDDLDRSIARGFNPDLRYEVEQTQYHGCECCIHRQCDAHLELQVEPPRDGVKPFEYHCAHLYYTYLRTLSAIYGDAGAALSARVLKAFAEQYGEDAADGLRKYQDTDFDHIN